jgi:hypothetical protein
MSPTASSTLYSAPPFREWTVTSSGRDRSLSPLPREAAQIDRLRAASGLARSTPKPTRKADLALAYEANGYVSWVIFVVADCLVLKDNGSSR